MLLVKNIFPSAPPTNLSRPLRGSKAQSRSGRDHARWGDNVNFNRTFAEFGLDKNISRVASLLEENTLMGIGAEQR